jgi:uncharacterized protein
MTFEKLKVRTRKELAEMAKRHRVSGWHGMRKDELIEALLQKQRGRKQSHSANTSPRADSNGSAKHRNGSVANGQSSRRVLNGSASASRDKLIVQACDPWWLHARWEITQRMIGRAEAALGAEWHRAVPVIRMYDVSKDDLGTNAKSMLKDIEIHGNVDHWFIPVDKPAQELKLQIGYRTASGKFFALARSNKVSTPLPGTRGRVSWGAPLPGGESNGFQIREIHETKPATIAFLAEKPNGGKAIDHSREYPFNLEAELIVYGSTDPRCEFTLMGEQVPVSQDGSFSVRFHLPNGRQVVPAVTVTPDGSETRTIVMAIERNTKELEPQHLEEMNP